MIKNWNAQNLVKKKRGFFKKTAFLYKNGIFIKCISAETA